MVNRDVRVALIDSQPVFMEGVASLLAEHGGYSILAKGVDLDDAVVFATTFKPDILLLGMDDYTDLTSSVGSIKARSANTFIVMFSGTRSTEEVLQALDSGIDGFLLKSEAIDELFHGLKIVMDGEKYISQHIVNHVISAYKNRNVLRDIFKLTIREQQIISQLLKAHTNRQIASELGLSEKTVKHYMTVLMQKLQVHNRMEVVMQAQRYLARSGK